MKQFFSLVIFPVLVAVNLCLPAAAANNDAAAAIRAAEQFIVSGYNHMTPQPYNPHISATPEAKALRQLYEFQTR